MWMDARQCRLLVPVIIHFRVAFFLFCSVLFVLHHQRGCCFLFHSPSSLLKLIARLPILSFCFSLVVVIMWQGKLLRKKRRVVVVVVEKSAIIIPHSIAECVQLVVVRLFYRCVSKESFQRGDLLVVVVHLPVIVVLVVVQVTSVQHPISYFRHSYTVGVIQSFSPRCALVTSGCCHSIPFSSCPCSFSLSLSLFVVQKHQKLVNYYLIIICN